MLGKVQYVHTAVGIPGYFTRVLFYLGMYAKPHVARVSHNLLARTLYKCSHPLISAATAYHRRVTPV